MRNVNTNLAVLGWLGSILLITGNAEAQVGDVEEGMSRPVSSIGRTVPYHIDSGVQANPGRVGDPPAVVYTDLVATPDAVWTRLIFSEITLERGSTIRFTSLADGSVQEFDGRTASVWSKTSAYFNGPMVLIELIAAPGTQRNRFVLKEISVEFVGEISGHCDPPLQCGICNGSDDRVPSQETWVARLFTHTLAAGDGQVGHGGGCSAAIWNKNSCALSAGHCIGGDMVLQFNVPLSNPDCTVNHPLPEDQFPITGHIFQNSGVGADWAVLTSGVNHLGETAYERFGEYRPVADSTPSSGTIEYWGYGVSEDCLVWSTQQHSTGPILNTTGSAIYYAADATCGNSGSSIVHEGEIVGIVTHCTWTCPPNGNIGTRIDVSSFANAREQLCPQPDCPWDFNGDGVVDGADLGQLLANWGVCSDCDDCPWDVTGDCTVDGADLGQLLANWGECP